MAIRFRETAWRDMLDTFVRTAKQAHLATPGDTEFLGAGYRPHKLLGARWTIEARGTLLVATYPELVWVFADESPDTIAGYYVTNEAGGVIWDEPFGQEPFKVKRKGDNLAVEMVVDLDLEAL